MSLILITGSCGLVGSEAVKFFSEKGFDVVGIDNNSRLNFFPTTVVTLSKTIAISHNEEFIISLLWLATTFAGR